jgi:hypothetical protein
MKDDLLQVAYTVELKPGEELALPDALKGIVGPGRWIVTVQPFTQESSARLSRRHDAFLNSYAPGDEGLYDDLPG